MDATDIGGFEGDQSGMGQGLAYVLPQSRTTGYFMQLANEKAQERRNEAALLAKQQQKANEDYANHLYQFKTPEIANEYTKWLQPKFDDLLQQASDYHTKTGQDPFTNPHFIQQSNDLNTVAKSTHQANLRATALGTALADKSKNYTPESKQAATEWLQSYYKDPVTALYNAPPPLQQRDLDLNDAIKLGHANANEETIGGYNVTTPDRHGHIVQGQTILNQPEFHGLLVKRGIDPNVGDIGGIPNGHGGTLYPTNDAQVNAISDHILQNAQQPHYAATLQAAGIDANDPHAKDKLADLVKKQNYGYGNLYSEFADRLGANVGTKKIANYGEDRLALSEANLSLAQQRLALEQQKQAAKLGPTYVQDLAERTRNKVLSGLSEGPHSIKNPFPELDALYVNNPSYKRNIAPIVNPDNTITINVPAEYKTDAKVATVDKDGKVIPNTDRVKIKDAYQVTLDPSNPEQFNTAYGALFDKVTGEKTGQASKINTLAGKGHLPIVPGQGQHQQAKPQKVIKQADIAAKAAAAGYTPEEYTQLLKQHGVTVQ